MSRFFSDATPLNWAILRGWILYDGHCGLCQQAATRWRARLQRAGFVFVSSIDDAARRAERGLPPVDMTEMRVIRTDGRDFGGARALAEIARHLWWAVPLSWLPRFPLTAPLAEWGYRRLANNRHRVSRLLGYDACTDGCAVHHG